jgi:flotillin
MKMEAEAKGIYEILTKQAEGFKKLVEAAGDNSKDAVMLMIADKLPELVKTQVDAIKNIKIDKVTVWENGGNKEGGGTSTANFMKGMMGSIPPLNDLFEMAGMELPDYLKGKTAEDLVKDSAEEAQIIEDTKEDFEETK